MEGRHRRRPGVRTQNLGEREGGPLIGGPGGVARENYGGGAAAARGAAVRGELGVRGIRRLGDLSPCALGRHGQTQNFAESEVPLLSTVAVVGYRSDHQARRAAAAAHACPFARFRAAGVPLFQFLPTFPVPSPRPRAAATTPHSSSI